jgi:hypothetical protein
VVVSFFNNQLQHMHYNSRKRAAAAECRQYLNLLSSESETTTTAGNG